MSLPYAEVIGDPIVHSKSPLIHRFWLGKLGVDGDYRAQHVRPDEVEGYFATRRTDQAWRGCNVTIPHKEKVAPWLDRLDERARHVGAVNTVYRDEAGALVGGNTDVDGVAAAAQGLDLSGRKVCVIGAGGAARAAFSFLSTKGCAAVTVMARNGSKALLAAQACGVSAQTVPFEPGSAAIQDAHFLINATQLGMTGQVELPAFVLAEMASMPTDARVFDMVYSPLETRLLATARAHGLTIADGLTMLVGQAASAFERFFGVSAPVEHDAELRSLLTR